MEFNCFFSIPCGVGTGKFGFAVVSGEPRNIKITKNISDLFDGLKLTSDDMIWWKLIFVIELKLVIDRV